MTALLEEDRVPKPERQDTSPETKMELSVVVRAPPFNVRLFK
jgi:hypothetical protein